MPAADGSRGLLGSAATLAEAGRRLASLALVDAAVALPSSRPVCDAALSVLAPTPSSGGDFLFYRPSTRRDAALLVLCHPSERPSMCRSLADEWERCLRQHGLEVQRLDLEPRQQWGLGGAEELRAALTGRDPTGTAVAPEVGRAQRLVEECRFLVFVHPIFWFDVPAQLKGFQESVLSSGFAFRKLPEHWLLNRAAGVVESVPVARTLMRRYAAYGLLRDKLVFVTRTQGGPAAGLGIFGHGATSLESSVQFCGAHLAAVDTLAELDGTPESELRERVFPKAVRAIEAHCARMARTAASSSAEDGAAVAAAGKLAAC